MAEQYNLIFDKTDPSYAENRHDVYRTISSFSPHMVMFAVFDKEQNKYVRLTEYQTKGGSRRKARLEHLSEFLQLTTFPGLFTEEAIIVLETDHSSLIPSTLFDAANPEAYARLLFPMKKDHNLAFDRLKNLNAYNIYQLPEELSPTGGRLFQSAQLVDLATVLIESILIQYKNSAAENRLFVHAGKDKMTIIVLLGARLEYCNTFEYHAVTDFLYFLIFVMEQLELHPEETELVLTGAIDRQSAIYENLARYIRKIRFESYSDMLSYSHFFYDLPAHQYVTLLNAGLCELSAEH